MIANVHEAKSQLSKLLDAVERGEEVIITRRGNGVNRFRIVADEAPARPQAFGYLKGVLPPFDEWVDADAEFGRVIDEWMDDKL
ncbi:MAG: prevent-host-death family protein [Microbacteriaceae bacterium]|nr:prevent-host-death family protein [Microbacteriaceae bacterium]